MNTMKEYVVLHPISGITFDNLVEYNDFFFGSYEHMEGNIYEAYEHNELHELVVNKLKEKSFIGIKTKAPKQETAKQQAYEKMKQIEAVLRFFATLNNKNLCDIGIFDFRNLDIDFTFVIPNENHDKTFPIKGPRLLIKWNNLYSEYQICIDRLFEIISKENKSEIEEKIIIAIIFCSRAAYDRENTIGFLEAMIAMEALLATNSGGVKFQLKEYCPFLLGENLEDRKNISKRIDDLYKMRSKIAHGVQSTVDESSFEELWNIIVKLIFKFLMDEKLKKMKTKKDFESYMTDLKYS